MSKKIIQDIIAKAIGTSHHKNDSSEAVYSKFRINNEKYGFWSRVSLVILCVALILVVFLFFSSSFSRVSVKISTTHKSIDLDEMAVLNKDRSAGGIKYEIMKFDDTEIANVPSSGSKTVSRYATGSVTIYNSGKLSQKLVVGTRIETMDGLIYKIDKSITVPAAKTVPGSVIVSIRASATGSKYNISPTTFTIPGLKRTSKFNLITAKSSRDITGGIVGEIKISSKSDIDKARLQLEEVIRQKLTKLSAVQVPKGFILYNDAKLLSFKDNVVDGTSLATNFGETPVLKITGVMNSLIIDENEIRNFVMEKIFPDLSRNEKIILFDLDKLSFKIINKDRAVLGTNITVNLSGKIIAAWDFDEATLKSRLVGIKKSHYQDLFREFLSIEKAEATFSPSWALYFPGTIDRITLDKGL